MSNVAKNCLLLMLTFAMMFNQGCCSLFTSGPQTITVDSEPKGADVKIGPYKGKTPYTVVIPRGKDYVVQVKYGEQTETVSLEKSIEPVYWVNILFWPGLIIDVATAKMFKYSPQEYEFTFNTDIASN